MSDGNAFSSVVVHTDETWLLRPKNRGVIVYKYLRASKKENLSMPKSREVGAFQGGLHDPESGQTRRLSQSWSAALNAHLPNPRSIRWSLPYLAAGGAIGFLAGRASSGQPGPLAQLTEQVAQNTRMSRELLDSLSSAVMSQITDVKAVSSEKSSGLMSSLNNIYFGHLTGDIKAGTFNTFADKGRVDKGITLSDKDQASLLDFVRNTDVAGLQEVESDAAKVRVAEALMDSREIYFGDSSNPIVFDPAKFDLVDAETMLSHDRNEMGSSSDQRRTTNAVVLRQKTTDALVLVVNRHQDWRGNQIDENNRAVQEWQTFQFIHKIRKKYSCDLLIDLGDFNRAAAPFEQNQSHTFFASGVDRIAATGYSCKAVEVDRRNMGKDPANGDWFHHDRLIAAIQGCRDPRRLAVMRRQATETGKGSLIYSKENFRGQAQLLGFGLSSQIDAENGTTLSVASLRLSPNTHANLYFSADGSESVALASNRFSTLNPEHQRPLQIVLAPQD